MKKIFLVIIVVFINSITIIAQGSPSDDPIGPGDPIGPDFLLEIEGKQNVYPTEVTSYRLKTSGITIYDGNWQVSGGDILGQTSNQITIKWTGIDLVPDLITGDIVEVQVSRPFVSYDIISSTPSVLRGPEVLINIDSDYLPVAKPEKPFIKSQTCNKAIIEKLPAPSGITWYWQGMNPKGTDTSNASTTFEVTTSGTYYLRALKNSGGFSEELSSIDVLLTGCDEYISDDENYVHKIDYQQGYQENELGNTENEKIESITYYDALGRPKQSVGIKQSPQGKDMVTHIAYDAMGRKVKEYLPYTSTQNDGGYKLNAEEEIIAQYSAKFSEDINTSAPNPFSEKGFDHSPLNRVMQQAAPGYDWRLGGGHEIGFDYQTNVATDAVRKYEVAISTSGVPSLTGITAMYEEGQLYKNITKDENHDGTDSKLHTTEEFKNKLGQVILKRTYASTSSVTEEAHDTYYVYDDYGNLTYVLPPKVVTNDGISSTELTELCYQYKYDDRNRLVEKKIPGKGWEYIIYDALDRPVLTQDAKQRITKEWMFTKYDALGRTIYTGIYTHGSIVSQQGMQDHFDAENLQNATDGTSKMYEEKTTSGSLYYTNANFPNTNTEVLTINYFDNYTFDRAGVSTTITAFGVANTANVRSLETGSKVKVLGTNKWITTVSFYDKKARPIYVYSKNDYLQTTDIVESELDFVGKTLKTKATHLKSGKEAIVTIDTFTYDHAGRVLSQSQCIGDASLTGCSDAANTTNIVFKDPMALTNNKTVIDNNSITLKEGFEVKAAIGKSVHFTIAQGNAEVIVENEYDELGQLKTKKVGGGLQEVDYTYNIRGWLKKINGDAKNDNDLFNFSLKYNDIAEVDKRLYNGNIAQTTWSSLSVNTSGNPKSNQYTYTYDALNRIIGAIDNTGNYNLGGYNTAGNLTNPITYDKNGNILTLLRKGHLNDAASSFGIMDNLQYTYGAGNKLEKVADSATNDKYGFKDDAVNTSADTADDYTYDVNGNMVSDTNKGITNITYNHLNLPTQVNIGGSKIEYVYDAVGSKLEKRAYITGNGATTTQYAGGFIYKVDPSSRPTGGKAGTSIPTLEFLSHSEGYIKPVIASGSEAISSFEYVYQYKDHLGNVRLSYTDNNKDGVITSSSEIIEESNYYPFGLKHKGYNGNISSLGNSTVQKFGYNGKELNEELGIDWHDFGARNYDASIGRWMNLDPLTEAMYTHSPYNFGFNNPAYFIDPDGRMAFGSNEQTINGYYNDGAGNVVYDPNINSQKELDELGIDGAKYIGDTYYDSSTGTYYDENGKVHYNKKYCSRCEGYVYSLGYWLSNTFTDRSPYYIGSGFVLLGQGNGLTSNNKSKNPSEDIYIPSEVIDALKGITAKFNGKDNSLIKNIHAGLGDAGEVERIVTEFGKIIKGEGLYSKSSLNSSNYSIKDTTSYILQYWKDGIPMGGSGAGIKAGKKGATEAAKKEMQNSDLDSIQVIKMY
ncbi:hypothetical protein T190115A13A_20125 [Tenacibaculum sp. 190524A02b]|uniref:DUF6443 domain-containing protein n=1 Tax=Tenacibaculum vairaonense TaxID=3137860 RepID=A0ABP1FE47_9FLAO